MKGKICDKCKRRLSIENFYSYKRKNKNGEEKTSYHNICKGCSLEKSYEWIKNNPEKRKIAKKRYDSKPDQKKRLFENSKRRREKGLQLEWQRKNKEKVLIYSLNRRAFRTSLPNTLTEEELEKTLKKFNYKCSLSDNEEYGLEHFIPLSWGFGGTTFENIVPMNEKINSSKGNKNPFEWIKTRDDIDKKKWNKLIKYLAKINDLTVEEYKNFVTDYYNQYIEKGNKNVS